MTMHMPFPAVPTLLPLVVIFSTFAFILSVIVVSKSPKAGACLVAGLILAAFIFLARGARGGMFSTPMGLPFAIIPGTFLFILVVIVLAKDPKAGATLIVSLLVLGLLGLSFVARVPRQPTAATVWRPSPAPMPPAYAQPGSSRPLATPAPIWSPGVDKEMAADIYPSALAAARAAGPKLGKAIRALAQDANQPPHIVVFQEAHPYQLIAELRDAVRRALPEGSCDTEAQNRPLKGDELGITLYLMNTDVQPAPWARRGASVVPPENQVMQSYASSSGAAVTVTSSVGGLVQDQAGQPAGMVAASGQLDINLSGRTGKVHIPLRYTDKPWIEDFATFVSTRPQQEFRIARSLGTCTSESEASQQALDDARAQLAEAIRPEGGSKLGPSMPPITATDVLQGGFIVDRFAQSLEGSAARIWRQALLLDFSGAKRAQLADQKARESRQAQMSYARMGLSAVGVILLIGAIYFFLNMATRGYYEWSLRIASVVLAVVAVISILMVVK